MKKTYIHLLATLIASGSCFGANAQTSGAVERDNGRNQAHVYLRNGEVKYYNTDDIDRLLFDCADMTVRHQDATLEADLYSGTVERIEFRKASEGGFDGVFENREGAVRIKEARGWQECAYITWDFFADADNYNVYVKGGNYSDYTKIDPQLARRYKTYGRADIPGLTAGTYAVKVVPVREGAEIEGANEATAIKVTSYDRTGFAHLDMPGGVGAYDNDGSLKKGAVVFYITNDNFNTVQLEMVTNNKGGKELFTGLGEIFKAKQKGFDTTPIAVRVVGMLDADKIGTAQLLSDQKGLLLKGNNTDIDFQVTIEGIGEDATLKGFGLGFVSGKGAEVRNLAIMLHGSSDDNLEIKGTQHIWIHNNDFYYGKKGGGDHDKGDGSLDAKDDCTYATFSYNHFVDSGKSNLCGMKSEHTDNLLVYHHNWYDHSDSRHPRVRTSSVHVFNNYFDGCAKYGIGATMGCSIFVEANCFRGCARPMMSSKQGTDATGEGTFSGENGGIIKSFGNLFLERSSKFSYITWQTNKTSFDAYEASTRDEVIPETVVTLAGATTYNNFDTSAKMFGYTPDATADLPSILTGYARGAGRLNHGDIRFTFNNSTDDSDYGRNAALDAILASYKSELVGYFGAKADEGNGDDNGDNGNGDDNGDNQGGNDEPAPTPDGTIVCDFTSGAASNQFFSVTGNCSNSKGTATYGGKTYSNCLKMESATSVKFTLTEAKKLTLVFGDSETGNIKIDGTKQTSDSPVLTADLAAGAHELTKADSRNLFLIILE